MNRELALNVADAVLYEGYMLYPYRPSALKNQQRWSFGILYPPAYEEVNAGTERSVLHSECLLEGLSETHLHLELRFLRAMPNKVSQGVPRNIESPKIQLVDETSIEGRPPVTAESLEFAMPAECEHYFQFRLDGSDLDQFSAIASETPGTLSRETDQLTGVVSVSAKVIADNLRRLTIEIRNTTVLPLNSDRNSALLSSLLSAHAILSVTGGEFVSLLDPPEVFKEAAADCRNIGNFPVLVGTPGERDMLLVSPIILYDYPQVAPESVGDFYDATEMDEMLTLRVMTLTDTEKTEMQNADDRLRSLLQRTEQSAREQLSRTHGAMRSLRPVSEEP